MRIVKQLFVLTLVALVLESQLSAEVPGARLLASGSIMVNGHQAPDNTVLFDGDMVGVGASSRAIIQQQGFAAFLEPGTQVKYLQSDGKNSVEVLSGASTISLRNKSAGVVFRGLTAHPKTPEAKVVIGLEHGRPAMMASGGDLIVTSGTASMTLLNGSALVQDTGTTGAAPAGQTSTAPGTQTTPTTPNSQTTEPTSTAQTTASTSQEDYCSEENQNKDKKRRKKCAGAQPQSGFKGFNVITTAVVAGAILVGALYAFGAFDTTTPAPPCVTPPCPLLK
jgi:hypothetical protein